MKGRYKITTMQQGKVVGETEWIHNMVMRGVSNGTGIIARQLISDTTYPIGITSAAIGTSATAPAITDTALVAPVLSGIVIRTKTATSTKVTLSFFITDAELANGTYREFGLFCGARLFARSLISPVYTKASGQDAIITYEIDIT
jgi:hypothetical protein